MNRSHKIRMYPTKAQAIQLSKTVGVARYAYNWGIDLCEKAYKAGEKHPSGYDLRKKWVSTPPEWAKEVAASCIYRAFMQVEGAYTYFFRYGARSPKYHKKGVHDSFYVAGDKGKLINNKVRIPGVGYVKLAESLRFDDFQINSYVVSRKAGKWYVSIQCEVADEFRTESTSVVGVDVGIKNWAIASDGTICETPKQLKHYRRLLAKKQRLLVRKAKGSNRRAKAVQQIQKVYQKITNIKLDTIHKFTATIAKNHGTVVVEGLNVKGICKSGLASIRRGANRTAMAEILRQLKYKCNSHVVVDRFYPSSKTCSNCGNVKTDLTLSDRTYRCHSCGFSIDRDLNAAINLRNKGLDILSTEGHSVNARGGRD